MISFAIIILHMFFQAELCKSSKEQKYSLVLKHDGHFVYRIVHNKDDTTKLANEQVNGFHKIMFKTNQHYTATAKD